MHSHSHCSDGVLSPADLVQRAKDKGVDVLALTDHDTVAGLAEAAAQAQHVGLCLIAGVEISTSWANHGIHVVGLGVAPSDPRLLTGLESIAEIREVRAKRIGERLQKAGFAGIYQQALDIAGQGARITRTHFAKALLQRGAAKNIDTVFKKYLKRGRAGYAPTQWAALADAVKWIKEAGGYAIIAHPGRYKLTATVRRALYQEFKEHGGDGIEVVHSNITANVLSDNIMAAKRYGFVASTGSDFHDPDYPWIELGGNPPLPNGVTPVWAQWSTDFSL